MHSDRPFLYALLPIVVITVLSTPSNSASIPSSPQPEFYNNEPFGQNQVNIAYFIQVSEATLTLVPRLLRTLWHPENLYIIHFDKKIEEWKRMHAETSLLTAGDHYSANVVILPSEPVTYRGISMVLNNLNAMQQALDHQISWTFFINISGADYPLVSPQNQRRLLASHDFVSQNRSFFSFSEREWWNSSKTFRYNRLFTDTSLAFNDSNAQVIDSKVHQPLADIHNFTFVASEAWMILHRSFVSYLLKSATSRRLLLAFSFSLEPEEHYFPAAVFNEPVFNLTTVPHALRHVVWTHNGKHAGQHPYYVDRKNKEDGSWTFQESIVKSGCFFTRKVRLPDSTLLTWIDEHVSGIAAERAVQADVDSYMNRVNLVLECLTKLRPGDKINVCFPEWVE